MCKNPFFAKISKGFTPVLALQRIWPIGGRPSNGINWIMQIKASTWAESAESKPWRRCTGDYSIPHRGWERVRTRIPKRMNRVSLRQRRGLLTAADFTIPQVKLCWVYECSITTEAFQSQFNFWFKNRTCRLPARERSKDCKPSGAVRSFLDCATLAKTR